MSRNLHQIGVFIACGWRLANGTRPLPVASNRIHTALELVHLDIPDQSGLTFQDQLLGRVCVDLDEIVYGMKAALLAVEDHKTGALTIQVDENTASYLLRRKGIGHQQGQAFGRALANALLAPLHAVKTV